ncbi:hypothetical protein K503DRAFT_804506 [Rhizopogon vinicolor AM-OR11-026]|uniref:Uncharacterized protein n=1 Tax=Rhizopogon vinicolor AM-OR11-026 TaxID=1314800 RepID=A0A1B7ML01_9AGAM|nr:hypothetical protein K503DRAFT_804506 [Rhizopogon vinicolor AM-OR11-026]
MVLLDKEASAKRITKFVVFISRTAMSDPFFKRSKPNTIDLLGFYAAEAKFDFERTVEDRAQSLRAIGNHLDDNILKIKPTGRDSGS